MTATLTLTLESLRGRTVPTRSKFQSPLLYSWIPEAPQRPSIIYLINQAGLTLGGDHFTNRIELRKNAHAIITTLSYPKVSRGNGKEAFERTHVTVHDQATLEWISDPSILFKDAQANHLTTVKITQKSRIIWISGQMLGRIARGEKLSFKRWRHRFEIFYDSTLTFLETWSLNPKQSRKAIEILLENASVMGFGLIVSPLRSQTESHHDREHFSNEIGKLCETKNNQLIAGTTSLAPNITLVRFLAQNGQTFREFSRELWKRSRLFLLGEEPPHLGKL